VVFFLAPAALAQNTFVLVFLEDAPLRHIKVAIDGKIVGVTVIEAFDNGSGFVFDSTDFIGAVKAGETPWYAEWAIPGSVQ
jgi:hypothetical protein